jgi:hypothetical protein
MGGVPVDRRGGGNVVQQTVEEFARNIRAGHEKAVRQARPTGTKADSRE